jgi:hypothetical protein
MPEAGLSAAEVGKEIAEHLEKNRDVQDHRGRRITIIEAILLASEAELRAMEARNFDAATFNTWFTAWVAGDQKAEDLAARRFSDEFKVAFDAWIVTDPLNNPAAPKGPTFMPEYVQPQQGVADEEVRLADEAYEKGAKAGETADDYVRTTVLLASVLFLVGISGHFRIHAARVGLIGVSVAILIYGGVLLILAPKPA